MLDEIGGDIVQAFGGADQRFELGPFAGELRFAFDFFGFGELVEFLVEQIGFVVRQIELDQRDSRSRWGRWRRRGRRARYRRCRCSRRRRRGCRLSAELDRGAGEADEGGVRQGIANGGGVAIDEVVLAAVRLVGHDDDVAAVAQQRVHIAFRIGAEFLDGGEDHAASRALQQLAQLGAGIGLLRRLAEELAATGEGAEELIVQVVAVGEHDDGRVCHGRFEDELAGEEEHGQALAGALGVPDDAALVVAVGSGGFDGAFDGLVDRVVLVIPGDLLDDGLAVVFEDDEGADQIEEPPLLEHALDEGFELVGGFGNELVAVDGLPGHSAFEGGVDDAEAGLDAVGDHFDLVVGEEGGQVLMVGLELVPGSFDGGLLVGEVLQLDDGEGDAVDEDDDVGPAMFVFDDGELVDGAEVVVFRVVEVDQGDVLTADFAVVKDVDFDAVDEHVMEGAVGLDEGGAAGGEDLADGFVDGFRRATGIDPSERFAEHLR